MQGSDIYTMDHQKNSFCVCQIFLLDPNHSKFHWYLIGCLNFFYFYVLMGTLIKNLGKCWLLARIWQELKNVIDRYPLLQLSDIGDVSGGFRASLLTFFSVPLVFFGILISNVFAHFHILCSKVERCISIFLFVSQSYVKTKVLP